MAPPQKQYITRLAFLLAALLIAVTSSSLLFVGLVANQASSDQRLRHERRLFRTALNEDFHIVIHTEMNIAHSDETVRKIIHEFDYEYAREILGDLSKNHGQTRNFIVSSKKQILAETFNDYTHISTQGLPETPELNPIIKKAQRLYRQNRVRVPGGFSHKSIAGLPLTDYSTYDIIVLDGKPAVIGAVPITPGKENVQLPDGPPTLLLSAHYVDEMFIKKLNRTLGFKNLTFIEGMKIDNNGPMHLLSDINGTVIGAFTWNSEATNGTIWPTVIPVVIVLSLALAVLASWIAWRIGRLTSWLQKSEQNNRYLALHDSLTGLANRLNFNQSLSAAIEELPDVPFAILHCDLDKFKQVNDTYGHAAGDAVIRSVAARMTQIVGETGLCSRIGGDEFIILLKGTKDRESIQSICEELIDSISMPVTLQNGTDVYIGLSIGIATAEYKIYDEESLMALADTALYASKDRGRNCLTFANDLDTDTLAEKEAQKNISGTGSNDAA